MHLFEVPSIAPECGIDSYPREGHGRTLGKKIATVHSTDTWKMARFLYTANKD